MPTLDSAPEAVRRQLERILASASFTRNERLSRFLRFVVEGHLDGRDNELKESLIGLEVFGSRDYDPKQDSIVRTEAGRLRARLAEYYAGDGSGDAVIIELPKGGYVPVFRQADRSLTSRPGMGFLFGTRAWLLVTLAGVALALAASGLWWNQRKSAPIPIAVLPLDNASHDPADQYLADGLTDELITNLSVIEGLAVRSQTSSFALKGQTRDVREAGKQLNTDYILEGSVLRAGQKLRINVQFVRVPDEFLLWSGRFDRDLTDVFAIQDEISRAIVNSLRLKLGRGRRRYETSVEAYDLYLRANFGQVRQISLFEQVIALDPHFAPAYASLSKAYAQRSIQFPVDHPADELPKMRSYARKAMELDPLLPEAHHALARAYARDADWKQAEKSFRRAIELDPNRANTYSDFAGWFLSVLGRNEEALRQLRIAEKADPLNLQIQFDIAATMVDLGRYDEAIERCLKTPTDRPIRAQTLARARIGQGRTREAIEILERESRSNPLTYGFLGNAYARFGRPDEALKIAAAATYPHTKALIFAGLGDKDRTLEALDQMANMTGPQRVGEFLSFRELTFLRGDPRLKALCKKVGLPE